MGKEKTYHNNCRRLALAIFSVVLVLVLCSPAYASPLPGASHIWVNMSNDNGAKFETNGSYYLKFDGGGLNALHLTTDSVNNPSGEVTLTDDQSGTFYVTDTGGRGYSDDTVLMLAVKGTVPDDFRIHVTASGYTWDPVAIVNTLPEASDLKYVEGTLDEWFTAGDFYYGPQTWKPAGTNLPMAYPIFYDQDTSDTENNFSLMFIDLNAGPVSKAYNLSSASELENSGGVKIEFSFENLETFAAFNAYVWCNQSNQGRGISWTNRVSGDGSSVYEVNGIPAVIPTADFTANPMSGEAPLEVQFTDTSADKPSSWAWDFENDGVIDSTEQNPAYTYTAAGTYSVNMTVTNSAGSDSVVKTDLITVSGGETPGVTGLADSAWPKLGGADLNNTGRSPYFGAQTNATKWVYTAGGSFMSAVPVIGPNGTVYIGNYDKNVYAINSDGSLKWTYTAGDSFSGPPAVGADGTIYIGNYLDYMVYALNPDGTLKWTYNAAEIITGGPTIGPDGTIYIGNNEDTLYALNPDGTKKWSYPCEGIHSGVPAIGPDGTIYFGADTNLCALNPDGTLKWSYVTGGPGATIYGSPLIGPDGSIYFGSNDKNFYALNPDGTLNWAYTTGGTIRNSPVMGTDGTLYFGNEGDKKIYALNSDGTLKWTYLTGGRIRYASPAIGADGTIYIGSADKKFYALNPDGTLKWFYETGKEIAASPSIAPDGTVYIASKDGKLYAFDGVVNVTADSLGDSLTVNFQGTSPLTVTAWNWDFGDGTTSTEQNPSHTYASTGSYTVNLTITHSGGMNYLVQTVTVPVPAVSPVANFAADVTSGNAPLSVQFTDLSTGNPTSWAWDFENDGIVDSTEQNATYVYTSAGTYTVNLTVANAAGSDSDIKTDYVTVTAEPSGPQVMPGYNNIFVKVANEAGVKYNAFENNTYNIRFEGINRGLNALHISTDPAVNFGQVTLSENQSGTFYATDSGGKGYEDEIILMVAVNGTIPDDFRLNIMSDGYTWTPNPVSNQPPSLDNVTYRSAALNETFTKDDFRYGPQIWKPTGNECDYPIFGGQNLSDTENTFRIMFIDLNSGVLRPNADLENRGAVRINYTFENLETFAAFSVYGYCQNSNNGDDMVAWSNALASDKPMSGYSVIGSPGPVVSSVEISPSSGSLKPGENMTFSATAFDDSGVGIPGAVFTWSSDNEVVGTVDSDGVFSAIAEGSTNVTATSGGVSTAALVTVSEGGAKTYVVDPSGSGDFTTIQSAVDAASAGDLIIVKDGNYGETISVTKGVSILSENGAASTVISPGKNSGFVVTADNAKIEGFTIDRVNGNGNFGVLISSADDVSVLNNSITNCREGIKLDSAKGALITGNYVLINNNAANKVLWLISSGENSIYFNTFERGTVAVEEGCTDNVFSSPVAFDYLYNNNTYSSQLGNEWPGYTGTDSDGNGIGDSAYTIPDVGTDDYPLVSSVTDYTLLGESPAGKTWTVDPSGSGDFTTIQAAVDGSEDGDTIIVKDGNYGETISVTKGVSILSENGAVSTVISPGKNSGFVVTADNAKIEGFTIDRVNGNGNFGVLISSADDVSVLNNSITNCREGLKLDSAKGALITGNNVLINNNAANKVLWLVSSGENSIYFNTFERGTVTVEEGCTDNVFSSPDAVDYAYNSNTYSSKLGNKWPGYTGTDSEGNGIGDTPYVAGTATDNFPLMSYISDYTTPKESGTVTTVTISPESATITKDSSVEFTAGAYDQYGILINGTGFTWSVENETIGTVSDSGVFTGVSAGNTNVSAEADGVSASAAVTVLSHGQTWYVNSSGTADFTTMTAAINNASAGDIIIVSDGEYNEYITIDKTLTLRSENGPESTAITSEGSTAVTITAAGVTFEGFKVTGAVNSKNYGVAVTSGGDKAKIINNNISLNYYGIYADSVSGFAADNNCLCSNKYSGLYISNVADGAEIINNNIIGTTYDGMSFFKFYNGIISGNLIKSGGQTGITFTSSGNSQVINNSFINNGYGGTNRDWAICFSGSTDNMVYANNFVGNKEFFHSPEGNSFNSEEAVDYTFNGNSYSGKLGNYYGGYFLNTDSDGNGINDQPDVFSATAVDNYPLILPSETYFGKDYSVPVPTSITLKPETRTLKTGYPLQYSAHVYDQNSAEMTVAVNLFWSVADTGIATINGLGEATAVSAGNTNVIVRCASIEQTAELTVEGGGGSGPRTIVVDQNGAGDVVTISSALNFASEGDLILINSGTYPESLVISTPSVTLRPADGAGTVKILSTDGYATTVTVSSDTPGVTLEGLYMGYLTGGSPGSTALYTYSGNLTVTNCSAIGGSYGMWIKTGSGNRIIGNTIYGTSTPLTIHSVSESVISGNNISGGGSTTVYIRTSSTDNLFSNNLIEADGYVRLSSSSSGNTIRENTAISPSMRKYWINPSSGSGGNYIYENNLYNFSFLMNDYVTAADILNVWNATEPVTYTYRGKTFTGMPGNYLANDSVVDLNGDGLGDTPVIMLWNNTEYNPLVGPWHNGVIASGAGDSYIRITPENADLKVGEKQKFDAVYVDSSGGQVENVLFTWTSEDETVGTVDGDGMFTALSAGQTNVKVTNGTVEATAGIVVTKAKGKQEKKVEIKVPGCNVTTGANGTKTISLNSTGSDVTVGAGGFVISEQSFNITVTTEGSPEVNGSTVSGTIAGITLETNPIVTSFNSSGAVSGSIEVNLTGIPESADLDVTISDNISADAQSAFQLAASGDGLNIDAVSYVMNINKTNLANGKDISDATIRMSVSKAWVDANGGNSSMKIIRWAEDGTKEVLSTKSVGFEGDMEIFEAFSPNGLSLFGLSATSSSPAPSSGTSTGSSSSSSSSGGGGSSSIGTARIDKIGAGDTGVFTLGETAISSVELLASAEIPEMMLTSEKVSKPSGIDEAPGEVYQYIQINEYLAPEGSMQMATLKFSVDKGWLSSVGSSDSGVKMYRYDEDSETWVMLSTVANGETDSGYRFFADTPSFSLFAVTAEKGAASSSAVSSGINPSGSQTESGADSGPQANVEQAGTGADTPAKASGSSAVFAVIAVFAIIAVCGVVYRFKKPANK